MSYSALGEQFELNEAKVRLIFAQILTTIGEEVRKNKAACIKINIGVGSLVING